MQLNVSLYFYFYFIFHLIFLFYFSSNIFILFSFNIFILFSSIIFILFSRIFKIVSVIKTVMTVATLKMPITMTVTVMLQPSYHLDTCVILQQQSHLFPQFRWADSLSLLQIYYPLKQFSLNNWVVSPFGAWQLKEYIKLCAYRHWLFLSHRLLPLPLIRLWARGLEHSIFTFVKQTGQRKERRQIVPLQDSSLLILEIS